VGLLFGSVESAAESVVTGLSEQVRNPRPSAVDHWASRYPTYVDDLAVVCRQIVERHLGGAPMGGAWHWCGEERLTKYEQALAIGEILGVATGHLRPSTGPPPGAPRPRDCRLDCSALEALGIGRRTPFRQALMVSLRSLGMAPGA
jgi:dTDP-4-dehydrorhamnose reductase